MKTIYLIRHGESEYNILSDSEKSRVNVATDKESLRIKLDPNLTQRGKKQAEDTYDRLKDVVFDALFCSPLVRAKQTLNIALRGRKLPVKFLDELKEVDLSSNPTLDEIKDQAKKVLQALKDCKGETIAVVAHACRIDTIEKYLRGELKSINDVTYNTSLKNADFHIIKL